MDARFECECGRMNVRWILIRVFIWLVNVQSLIENAQMHHAWASAGNAAVVAIFSIVLIVEWETRKE